VGVVECVRPALTALALLVLAACGPRGPRIEGDRRIAGIALAEVKRLDPRATVEFVRVETAGAREAASVGDVAGEPHWHVTVLPDDPDRPLTGEHVAGGQFFLGVSRDGRVLSVARGK